MNKNKKKFLQNFMLGIMTAGALAVHAPAQAIDLNKMSAAAAQNTVGVNSYLAAGSTTPLTASFSSSGDWPGSASASVALTSMSVAANGGDASHYFDATSIFKEGFTLWNTTEARALNASERSGLSLAFDFVLDGTMTLPFTTGGTARSMSLGYGAQTILGGAILTNNGNSSLACGGSSPCIQLGNPVLLPNVSNVIDIDFSQSFSNMSTSTGQLFMSLHTLAAIGTTNLSFEMAGFRQTGGAMLPLAIRFDDGSFVNVTAVPEPAALSMLLAGLALLGVVRVRRPRQGIA